METPFFFGYGSLVNRKTLGDRAAHRAKLRGWVRMWRHTELRPVAYLTAVPEAGAEIEGLIAGVPSADWRELDEREKAYDRVVAVDVEHGLPHPVEVSLYHIPEGKHGKPDRAHPVLLSYIDVVVQGYLNEFGEEGVARFFATTRGWDAPIADDRADPLYARAQVLNRAERALVDRWLTASSAVVHDLEKTGLSRERLARVGPR